MSTEAKTKKKKAGRPRSEVVLLPIYDSMQACHAATGIPLRAMKHAKKHGSDAFRSNRVDLGRLIRWLFAQGDDDSGIDWNQELAKEKAKREKIKRLLDEKRVIDRDISRQLIQSGVSIIFTELERIFLAELPGAAKGMDERGIKGKAETAIEDLRKSLTQKFDRIGETHE
jgi:hypothetical protein